MPTMERKRGNGPPAHKSGPQDGGEAVRNAPRLKGKARAPQAAKNGDAAPRDGKGKRAQAKTLLREAPTPAPAPAPVASPPAAAAIVEPKPAGRAAPKQASAASPPSSPGADGAVGLDVQALAANATRFVEGVGHAFAAVAKPLEKGRVPAADTAATAGEVVRTLGHVVERWMMNPQAAASAQAAFTAGFVDLWTSTMMRLQGAPAEPPPSMDNRFRDAEWTQNPFFDFLRQAYLHTAQWAETAVEATPDLDPHEKHKAKFYVRQLTAALSPSNFVPTNPELLRQTLAENGANLVRGVEKLAEDIARGNGTLKLRQTDPNRYEVGRDLATTPGKVIFRNEIMELIQYAPTTDTVLKRPLLIVPPWINKFYILDLNPEKSFIRWAVSQGLTVFCISWVNPDARHAEKGFGEYMREGVYAALDAVEEAMGERDVTAIGYCVGGTLLAAALAHMAATGDKRISSATLFTTQVDFKDAGDLKVFVDEPQIEILEARMAVSGYLDGSQMANSFNMLRPNDLIWPYVVNAYMKGVDPSPFDLLFWNADSTRMPAKNHSFYLRNCYLENRLSRGEMELEGVRLDLGTVTIPVYNLAAREDHIAPARSVFEGSKAFGGEVTYVVAGSGHIAGVVNPAGKPKYQFWTGGPVTGRFEDWLAKAAETPGTWWPHWMAWLEAQAPNRVPAREPGGGRLKPLADAPGTYVKMSA